MYIQKKYNFKFPFDENNKCLHEQSFGCCSYWNLCQKENYCVIPERIGDGKKFCMLAKRMGFDKLKAVTVKRKTAHFRKNRKKRKG